MLTEKVTDAQIQELLRLAEEYAKRRNLDTKAYLAGIFQPLARDGETLDLHQICVTLTRYHKEWLGDLK